METFGPFLAFILTIMVFSYIIGDNPLFKLAAHIFVGTAIGYAIIVLWYDVLLPMQPQSQAELSQFICLLPAGLLCIILALKITPQQNDIVNLLGGISMAFVLGVGAALAVGGALFGTLIPQTVSTMLSLNPTNYPDNANGAMVMWLNNFIIILGTVGTLAYFTFTTGQSGPLSGLRQKNTRFWRGVGRLMIIFTLAALFANTITARMAVLISQLQFLVGFIQ